MKDNRNLEFSLERTFKMNLLQKTKWESLRQKGKSHYLLTRGVIPYSLGFTFIFGLIEYFSQESAITVWTPIRLFIFGLVGFFMANSRWQSNENKFSKSS